MTIPVSDVIKAGTATIRATITASDINKWGWKRESDPHSCFHKALSCRWTIQTIRLNFRSGTPRSAPCSNNRISEIGTIIWVVIGDIIRNIVWLINGIVNRPLLQFLDSLFEFKNFILLIGLFMVFHLEERCSLALRYQSFPLGLSGCRDRCKCNQMQRSLDQFWVYRPWIYLLMEHSLGIKPNRLVYETSLPSRVKCKMEPKMGVEPTLEVYKTTVLPLNY